MQEKRIVKKTNQASSLLACFALSVFLVSCTASLSSSGLTSGATGTAGAVSSTGTSASGIGSVLNPVVAQILPCTVRVGQGLGESLTLSQTANNLVNGAVVCIHGGNYSSLQISNIAGSAAAPITIQNDGGVVDVANGIGLASLSNVILSGAGTAGITYGLTVHDYYYRGVQGSGQFANFTLQNLSLLTLGDYDGADSSVAFLNLTFTNIQASNIAATILQIGMGEDNTQSLTGVSKNLVFSYSSFDSSSPSAVLWMGLAFNVNVHHNSFTHINLTLDDHNGIVFLLGDGHVHHNYYNDYLGNTVRVWPVSLDSVGQVMIDHNVAVDSVKYSAFEIQPFTTALGQGGRTTYTNIVIENNTVGQLNTGINLPTGPALWFGALLDLYSFDGGTLTLQNNTAFDINNPSGSGPIINTQGNWSTSEITQTNNSYFATPQAAGLGNGALVYSDVDTLP
jgi:hypothetical protein